MSESGPVGFVGGSDCALQLLPLCAIVHTGCTIACTPADIASTVNCGRMRVVVSLIDGDPRAMQVDGDDQCGAVSGAVSPGRVLQIGLGSRAPTLNLPMKTRQHVGFGFCPVPNGVQGVAGSNPAVTI